MFSTEEGRVLNINPLHNLLDRSWSIVVGILVQAFSVDFTRVNVLSGVLESKKFTGNIFWRPGIEQQDK